MRPFIWLVFLALLGEIRFMFRWWAFLAREARKERRRRHETARFIADARRYGQRVPLPGRSTQHTK